MQIGFNNDVEHDDVKYHVQTEDHGLGDGRITTQVFRAGQIVDTVTVSYSNAIRALDDDGERDAEIRKRMKALHALCFRKIKDGKYGDDADELTVPPGAAADEAKATPSVDTQDLDEVVAESEAPAADDDEPDDQANDEDEADKPVIETQTEADEASESKTDLPKAGVTKRPRPVKPPPLPRARKFDPSVSDTAEDGQIPALKRPANKAAAEPGPDGQPDESDGDDTVTMDALPEDLPPGIRVAGDQDELGEDVVAANSRGEVLDIEEMEIDDLSDAGLIPLDEGDTVDITPRESRVPLPMYSYHRAYRGLDYELDDDLPGLLSALLD